jgi:DNA-binding FadR family transcriptional regulator
MAVALDGMNVGVDDHAFREADYRFHSALIAASGVPSLEFFADILRDILSATIREVPLVERVEQLRPVHEAIYVAVRDRDPIGAMRAVDAHFEWLEQAAARGTFSQ